MDAKIESELTIWIFKIEKENDLSGNFFRAVLSTGYFNALKFIKNVDKMMKKIAQIVAFVIINFHSFFDGF